MISGRDPALERQAALRDLQTGRVSAVFSVDLFNESVDLPSVDTLLLLRAERQCDALPPAARTRCEADPLASPSALCSTSSASSGGVSFRPPIPCPARRYATPRSSVKSWPASRSCQPVAGTILTPSPNRGSLTVFARPCRPPGANGGPSGWPSAKITLAEFLQLSCFESTRAGDIGRLGRLAYLVRPERRPVRHDSYRPDDRGSEGFHCSERAQPRLRRHCLADGPLPRPCPRSAELVASWTALSW